MNIQHSPLFDTAKVEELYSKKESKMILVKFNKLSKLLLIKKWASRGFDYYEKALQSQKNRRHASSESVPKRINCHTGSPIPEAIEEHFDKEKAVLTREVVRNRVFIYI